MNEIAERRKRLFSGARFSSALFRAGDTPGEASANFEYFSGCSIDGSYVALTRKGGSLFANGMNLAQARKESFYPVKLLSYKTVCKDLRKVCGRGKVAFSGSELSANKYVALRKRAKLDIVDESERALAVRGKKSATEIARLSAAAKATKKILDSLSPWDFKTEKELDSHLRIEALRAGCEVAFEPIVATGKNSSLPHHRSGAAKLAGHVLIDFGVKKESYCADFSRCYFKPSAKKEKEAYGKCETVFEKLLDALPDCSKGKDVAQLSEKLFKENGLPALIHSIGHGIGLEVHEYPHLGLKSEDSLEGAVLALEPAAYYQNRFGVRFEKMVANVKGKWKEI